MSQRLFGSLFAMVLGAAAGCGDDGGATASPAGPGPEKPTLDAGRAGAADGSVSDVVPISVPVKKFTARELKDRDHTPFPKNGATKHVRLSYNSTDKRIYTLGGDFSTTFANDSTNSMGFAYDVATDTWETVSGYCHGPGQRTPGRPDELPWAFDSTRNVFWALGGIMGAGCGAPEGAVCNSNAIDPPSNGSTYFGTGLLKFDPAARSWSRAAGAEAVSTIAMTGHFDPVRSELVFIEEGGCGTQVVQLNVSTLARRNTDFCNSTNPFPGTPNGTFITPPRAYYDHWAWDPAGRTGYIITQQHKFVGGEEKEWITTAYSWNADTQKITALPDPPLPPNGRSVRYDTINPVWDSKNKVMIWPFVPDYCGVVEMLAIYNPATNAWSTEPIVAPDGLVVRGTLHAYDPGQNVMMLAGSIWCGADLEQPPQRDNAGKAIPGLPLQTHMFLYRYGE